MIQPGARVLLCTGSVADWQGRAKVAPALWMSESEQARLLATPADTRRQQFVAGRWMLRELLCQWLAGTVPTDWSISGLADEPPSAGLAQGGGSCSPPCVSISHSGDRLVCAASDHPVGVDVEAMPPRRNRDLDSLMLGIGSRAEIAAWGSVGQIERTTWFHRLWVIKEAWLKARGEGVTPGRLQQLCTRPATPADAWTTWCKVSSIDVVACHASAVALRSLCPPDPPTAGESWWAVDDLAVFNRP